MIKKCRGGFPRLEIFHIHYNFYVFSDISIFQSFNFSDTRANRDKESLEGKLRAAHKSGVSEAPVEKRPAPSSGATHNIEPLRRKNYELEEEVRPMHYLQVID